jgi:hypothetical protein
MFCSCESSHLVLWRHYRNFPSHTTHVHVLCHVLETCFFDHLANHIPRVRTLGGAASRTSRLLEHSRAAWHRREQWLGGRRRTPWTSCALAYIRRFATEGGIIQVIDFCSEWARRRIYVYFYWLFNFENILHVRHHYKAILFLYIIISYIVVCVLYLL